MSWMDSWSRPSKSQATPPPLYLVPGGEATPYCKSCGRVISARKSHATSSTSTPAKYCSSRCRSHKPGRLDREIEEAFVKLLNEEEDAPPDAGLPAEAKERGLKKTKKKKGGARVLVSCETVERLLFETHVDPEKVFGRKRNRARRGVPDDEEWTTVDMAPHDEHAAPGEVNVADSAGADDTAVPWTHIDRPDGDVVARLAVRSGTRVRPAQDVSEVNGSVGGEKGRAERIEETDEMLEKRRQGQKRAHEREMVRCAARRGVAFGFVVKAGAGDGAEQTRLCEAVMHGKVVEASFAKGDWSIRWRE